MGFLEDLRYFGPGLPPVRALELGGRKLLKAARKRRLKARLAVESAASVPARLGLPAGAPERVAALRERWAPLAGHPALAIDPRHATPDVLRARADHVRAGYQLLFGRRIEVGWPPRWAWRWQGTPQAETFAADVRSTWELQRLFGLLPLAREAADADRVRAEAAATAYLEAVLGFHRGHREPAGLAWASALEVGLRLVALAQGLPFVVRSEAFARHETALLEMLDRHGRWLAVDLSLDKVVRGNHLLGELAGLVAAGALFAPLPEWARSAREVLQTEILRQIHPDGVSVEQSLTYEKFILEFLVVAGGLSAAAGAPFDAPVRERLRAQIDHLRAVTTPAGGVPHVGDCDSGRGADWGEPDPDRTPDLLRRAQEVFGPVPEPETPPWVRLFPQGGHAVVRPAPGDYAFLRAGPFGWGKRGPASHSHRDRLCPVLWVGGEPLLVDPGVYGYRVGRRDRDADRVARAHSGVDVVDALGPRPDGTFRWRDFGGEARLEPAPGDALGVSASLVWPSRGGALLWHRSLRYNVLDDTWSIADRLSGPWTGPVTWSWVLAPGVRVEPSGEGGRYRLTLPSGRCRVLVVEDPVRGGPEPGWLATAYGERVRTVVLRWQQDTPVDTPPFECSVRILPA